MKISDAASFFDTQPVSDAYTGEFLFNCQPDLYDSTTRDSVTGWRRSLVSEEVVVPTRGCIEFGSSYYLMGRLIEDFFQGSSIRVNAVIHPSDGLFSIGFASDVLASETLVSMHAAHAIRKETADSTESSQLFNTMSIFVSETEVPLRDQILVGPDGGYFRVQNVISTTGGYLVLACSELGVEALQSVTYIAAGAYDPVTDVKSAATPILTTGIVERYQTNFRYVNQANATYERGDKITTLLKSVVTTPKPDEELTVFGESYLIIQAIDDGAGCWEVHMRAA